MGKVIVVGILGAFASVVFALVMMFISVNNRDSTLRNQFQAKERSREAIYDETWKTIKQIAQVSDKYSDDFKKVYPEIMEARYGGKDSKDGALMKFVTESNPNFDISLYTKLTNVIESKRSQFTASQEELIDIKREHDNLQMLFPGSLFVMNKERIKITIVSSTKSKETMDTGVEDDVDLYK